MIIITGSAIFPAGKIGEATALGCEHSERSRVEPGCLSHNCLIDAENPHRIQFYETWADEAEVAQHFALPESRDFVRRMAELAGAPPELRIYRASPIDPAAL